MSRRVRSWLVTLALLAVPAAQARTPDMDVLQVADFGPIDGIADTATLEAAYAAATVRLKARGAATLAFPPGRMVLHGSPTLAVPVGSITRLVGQATELAVTDAGNGLTLTISAGAGVTSTRVSVEGFRLVKGEALGGSGVAILGGPFGQQTMPLVRDVTCRARADNVQGWTSCVLAKDVVLGTFDDIHGAFVNSFGSPSDGTLIRLVAGNSPADPSSRAVIDNKFTNLSSSGGFAGVWATGHVEGIYLTNFSFVGTAYGIYWPDDRLSGAGLYLAASNGHINAQIRGVYANRVFDVMNGNILFFNPFGDHPAAADAVLPQDNAPWATTPATWAGVDIQNAANFAVVGNTFYAAHVGSNAFASIVVDSGTDYRQGQDRPNVIVGNTMTGGNAPPIYLADGVRNTTVSGNATIAAPPMRLPSTVASAGNTVDGLFRLGDIGGRADLLATTTLDVSGNTRLGGGAVTLDALPTRDPHVRGRLWRDAQGFLRVSAGP